MHRWQTGNFKVNTANDTKKLFALSCVLFFTAKLISRGANQQIAATARQDNESILDLFRYSVNLFTCCPTVYPNTGTASALKIGSTSGALQSNTSVKWDHFLRYCLIFSQLNSAHSKNRKLHHTADKKKWWNTEKSALSVLNVIPNTGCLFSLFWYFRNNYLEQRPYSSLLTSLS